MKAKLIKTSKDSHHSGHYFLNDDCGFAIGSTDKDWCKRAVKKRPLYVLSLSNCQAIERGYDLDELARKEILYNDQKREWWKQGAKYILEILGDKKFSDEDVRKIVTHVLNELVLVEGFDKKYLFPESIYQETTSKCKSLQQTEWDVEIEMVPALSNNGNVYYGDIPKLDTDGCLILKTFKSE